MARWGGAVLNLVRLVDRPEVEPQARVNNTALYAGTSTGPGGQVASRPVAVPLSPSTRTVRRMAASNTGPGNGTALARDELLMTTTTPCSASPAVPPP